MSHLFVLVRVTTHIIIQVNNVDIITYSPLRVLQDISIIVIISKVYKHFPKMFEGLGKAVAHGGNYENY